MNYFLIKMKRKEINVSVRKIKVNIIMIVGKLDQKIVGKKMYNFLIKMKKKLNVATRKIKVYNVVKKCFIL